jgi:hypothetical protein
MATSSSTQPHFEILSRFVLSSPGKEHGDYEQLFGKLHLFIELKAKHTDNIAGLKSIVSGGTASSCSSYHLIFPSLTPSSSFPR